MNDPRISSSAIWRTDGNEMADRILSFDWAATPLGAIESWSPALLAQVNSLLASRFPLLLWWGPTFISIYNDAYAPILGAKHPWALGRPVSECWNEIWDVLRPLIETPFRGGAPTWIEDFELELQRHGYLEEAHFTVAYSPVPDPTAPRGIGGVVAAVHEISERVFSERRMTALRDLGSRAGAAETAEQACAFAAETLGSYGKDLPFALLYLIDPNEGRANLAGTAGITAGGEPCPPLVDLRTETDAAWPLATAAASEAIVVVEALGERFASVPAGPWSDPPDRAAVVPIPSNKPHEAAGFLVTGISRRLRLDENYRDFLSLVAGQLATAIANARAYDEERKRATALAELDRSKTAFFSNVSHEFRTPLTLMLAPIDELRARDAGPQTTELLDIVRRNGLRLQRMVNSLLDFSRIEAGRIQAEYEPTDLAALTADLASSFRSAVELAGLRLVVDCPPLATPVFVDHDMWEKIVLNLLSNAFKFTFAGEIAVRLREHDGSVVLSVRDTGVGIPEDAVPRLFERFYRVQTTRGRTHEGTGIGLALVQELAKLHGGNARAESREGKGSAFEVTIPLGSAHLPADRIAVARTSAPAAMEAHLFVEEALRWLPDVESSPSPAGRRETGVHASPTGPEEAHGRRPRILLADDNADMRHYIARLLGATYDVEAVADGEQALRAVQERPPDLVLSDVMMPGLDGFGLLRAMRGDPATETIPVLLLSARAGEECRVEGLRHGADDYLTKPFGSRELLARVAAHLDLNRIRREAKEAVRYRSEQFQTVVNQAPLGIYLIDSDFRIAQVNPVARPVFGDIQDLIGRDFDEVIHILLEPAAADEVVTIFRHTLATGQAHVEPEWVRDRADRGVVEHYEWRLERVLLPDGRHGLVCYFRDISKQIQARDALRDSEEQLRLIAGRLEHLVESRTRELVQSQGRMRALATELNLAEQRERKRLAMDLHDHLQQTLVLGKFELARSKKAAASLPAVAELVNKMDVILSDALTYTRTLVSELSPPGLLDHGLAAGLRWLGDYMRTRGVSVEMHLAEGADRQLPENQVVLLFQSIRELLINSGKHAGTGRAAVSLERGDGHLRAIVSDQGKGFDVAAITQATSELSSTFGLFSVRERMKALGGSFEIDSGIGHGTTVTLTLPTPQEAGGHWDIQIEALGPAAGDAGSAAVTPAPPETDAGPSKVRVLLVDDHAMVRQGLRSLLDSSEVVEVLGEAANGEEAIGLYQRLRPTLVVMDINMPKLNGIETTARIRALDPDALVIGLSINPNDENRSAMLRAGASMVLTKEAAVDQLVKAIREVAEGSARGPIEVASTAADL